MRKKKFSTIFWDVDNTLLDFEYSMRHSLIQCFQSVKISASEEMISRYRSINEGYWKRLELGEITKEQLLNGRFIDLFHEFDLEYLNVERFRKEYQENLGNVYAYLDDSIHICQSLQNRFEQYIVTNGVSSTQRCKLSLSGFSEVMNGIFVSEEIGYPKPDRRFFEYCLKNINEKDRDKVLIVGDSLTSDICGGNMVGIKTCWYNPKHNDQTHECKVDFEIENLKQIYDVLELG